MSDVKKSDPSWAREELGGYVTRSLGSVIVSCLPSVRPGPGSFRAFFPVHYREQILVSS